MRIECTKKEKELVLEAFEDANVCPFDDAFGISCSLNCKACTEKNIEWEIKDGEQE